MVGTEARVLTSFFSWCVLLLEDTVALFASSGTGRYVSRSYLLLLYWSVHNLHMCAVLSCALFCYFFGAEHRFYQSNLILGFFRFSVLARLTVLAFPLSRHNSFSYMFSIYMDFYCSRELSGPSFCFIWKLKMTY